MKSRTLSSESNPLENAFVTRIEIDDLFGLYTYCLGEGRTSSSDTRRLFLLYGENGAGKTTVLQLVFSLLSQARNRGHRGFLARTPFRRLLVRLGSDTEVSVTRPTESLVGSFQIKVTKYDRELIHTAILVDQNNRVPEQASLTEYLGILDGLNVALFFLSDDRKGRSSSDVGDDAEEERLLFRLQHEALAQTGRLQTKADTLLRSEHALELAIGRFVNWVRNQALVGSTTGELNTNTVYADIIRRISKPRTGRPAASERDLATLVESLRQLEVRNRSYASFGLTSPLNIEPIVGSAASASPATRRIVASVLGPYVDGLRARLEALAGVQDVIAVFVQSVNSFLFNKAVSFNLRAGLQIRTRNDEILNPKVLSSGERQLLLLLCNTVLARDDASIFLIDEPEISLNVKWQRKLIDALLSLTTDSPVQFIIATHSLELLTRHKESVRRLGEPIEAV